MEKALEILKEFKTQIETCPDDCWFELEQVNEAISELEEYHEFAESIRMLCDDRGGYIAELEEAMKPKTCEECKYKRDTDINGNKMSEEYFCTFFARCHSKDFY